MKCKILVIEDDAAIRTLLVGILEQSGYEVHACENGKTGIDTFDTIGFDFVITDIMMPGVNGIDVIKSIRQRNQFTSIMAISGVERSKSFLNMADYYTADYTMPKPFDSKKLLDIINTALKK